MAITKKIVIGENSFDLATKLSELENGTGSDKFLKQSDVVTDISKAATTTTDPVAAGALVSTNTTVSGLSTKVGTATLTTTAQDLSGAINELDDDINNATTGLAKKITDLEDAVGDMSTAKTTGKVVVTAINELYDSIATSESAGKVYLDTASTPTEGYLKTYVISQGKNASGEKIEVGKIDIPKDMVVTKGEVVKIDDEHATAELPAGTYIKLTIANQTNPIYINVKDLCDVYTAAADATQVQVAISSTNEISATLVDKGVAKAKLEDSVQTSLGKADSAIQSVAAGSANGTIAVDGSDVSVTGLKSAAFVDTLDGAIKDNTTSTNVVNAAQVVAYASSTAKTLKGTLSDDGTLTITLE